MASGVFRILVSTDPFHSSCPHLLVSLSPVLAWPVLSPPTLSWGPEVGGLETDPCAPQRFSPRHSVG